MASPPAWLKGRHLTAISVIGYVQGADLVLTASTTSSLSGIVDYVRFNSDPQHEMIQSVDRTQAHYELTIEDSDIVIGEILQRKASATATALAQLPSLFATHDFFSVTFTRGHQIYQMWAVRGRYGDGVSSFGKNVVEASFRPIDIDGTTPTVVFTP